MELKEKVEDVLKEVRNFLQAEGGDCELIEVKDGIAKVRLQGSCAGCPFSQITLKMRIEALIKQRVPEIREVVSVE
jgi:Fe-S cluster biogenesis protein NfuA